MKSKIYSIYKLTNQINGKSYIGKTERNIGVRIKEHQYDTRKGKSKSILCRAIRKYGWDNFIVEVLATTIDKNVLNYLEKFFIMVYNTNNRKFGYNLTDGGEGTTGYQYTKETIEKMAEIKTKYPPITQLSMFGVFMAEYPSAKAAERATGVNNANISKCCNREIKQSGGFLWCYIGDEDNLIIPDRKHTTNRPVEQLSMSGEVIDDFVSAKEAELATGVSRSNICMCLKGIYKQAGGFVWKYFTTPKPV